MADQRVAPTGVERRFDHNEIIVTKTDPKGVITYANDVFLRVSAYAEEDVVGKPHNIVRHPEMPRGIFHLLWSELAAGREMFAYCVNLARDGAHYWVFAHVTPSRSGDGRLRGYHSSRRLPAERAVSAVRDIYRELLDVERRYDHAPEAAAASHEHLVQLLARDGRRYDEWIWQLTRGAS
jgi:PAS domain S-box-containing protein